jgi:ABC-type glycerol-3-phosphate transport system substrate-binding protein
MDDFYTDPAFPGSSSARDGVQLLIQAILYGGKTIDQAYAEALANLEE